MNKYINNECIRLSVNDCERLTVLVSKQAKRALALCEAHCICRKCNSHMLCRVLNRNMLPTCVCVCACSIFRCCMLIRNAFHILHFDDFVFQISSYT